MGPCRQRPEEQKALFRNCLDVLDTPDGWLAVRFTPAQLDAYAAMGDAIGLRSRCVSGVKLAMRTDARRIRLRYTIKEQARSWANFDVFVNGRFVDSVAAVASADRDGEFVYDICNTSYVDSLQRLNRIDIYLPHLATLCVREIGVEGGDRLEPAEPASGRLLCMGDSITQGMEAIRPSCSFPVMLSRMLGCEVVNQGVGSCRFDKRQLDPACTYKPDTVIVGYGANDWELSASLSECERKCSGFIDALSVQYANARRIVLTPIWRADIDDVQPMGTFGDLVRTIRSACGRQPDITVLDGLELVPHQLAFYRDRGVHPNDEGFAHMAMNILSRL
ncbi:SGNH/GDSL hydrolase family protein [Paenibacillus cymbidii]|uniref:SGNH/GDSL hydrolase family protein n=1 Tax=Paenibacillus cymbidii TaxID=1639034 RepID=UPI001436791F|nr:SGNH/GDSL hydrolase family protein [Paenibacillus cymbidii]